MPKTEKQKTSLLGPFLAGLVGVIAGAAAVFFSKDKNRKIAEEKLEEGGRKAKEIKKKFEKAKKKVEKKAQQALKEIQTNQKPAQ